MMGWRLIACSCGYEPDGCGKMQPREWLDGAWSAVAIDSATPPSVSLSAGGGVLRANAKKNRRKSHPKAVSRCRLPPHSKGKRRRRDYRSRAISAE